MTTLLKQGNRLRFLIASLFVLMGFASQAQVILKGKVTGPNGAAISNASVQVEPSNAGTNTDASGNYSITTTLKPGKYTLVFSSVGYKRVTKAITVTGNDAFDNDVVLGADPLGLEEVVVTGTSAGTTKKQLGSYISVVKADQLTKGATGNVLAALQGKTAGAQITQNSGDPAGGMSVRLRGISSVSSSSDPLYIVDGIIVNNATNRVTNTQGGYDGQNVIGTVGQNRMVDINPADIERVEVLNGAAAAAIYGSRANAGVVQIFTKKGKSGKPSISFSTTFMSSSIRKKLDVNRAATRFGDGVLTQDIITANGLKPISLTPLYRQDTLSTVSVPTARYDYQDYIFRKAMGTDNNLSISGGNDKTKYYFSASYFFNEGIIKSTDFQRFSFRSNIDQVINKWANVSLGLNYINSSANEKPDGNSFYSPMNSINILGNYHNIEERDALGNIKQVGERGRVNPVSVIEDIKQKNTTNRILSNLSLKLKPIKNLVVDYTLGIDNYSQNGTTYIPPYAYAVNAAFYGSGAPGTTPTPTTNGYASAATTNFFAINHDLSATYNVNITKNITSVTQVGFSQQYEKNTYLLAQGQGLSPFVQTVTGASTLLAPADERSEISISGIFAQQNFRYKNQLFLTGAIRRDGSSVFGVNQRNQIYPKISSSFVISGTDFWQNSSISKWWDLAKIRLAYGESGNLTGIGAYSRFNTYSSSSFLSKSSLASGTTLANENVKPERQQEIEFGLDLAFLKNRVGLTVNVYNKRVKDLLINRLVAPSSGFTSLQDNIGKLENRGFELVLTGTPIQTKDFSWNITGIYNQNRNKVINTGQSLILFGTNSGAPVAIIEGQPLGVFYGTFFMTTPGGEYSKLSNGLPDHTGLVLNPNGIPRTAYGIQNGTLSYTQNDFLPGGASNLGRPNGTVLRKIIGNPNPKYTTTLTNEFSYKGFSLRVQIDAVMGVDVFNADFRTRQGVGNGKIAELEQNGQLPRGYISPYTSPNIPTGVTLPAGVVISQGIYAVEQWRVDNGSFAKLRELSFSYAVGKFKGLEGLTLSITGRNLKSWDKYIGYDPEVNAAGQSTLLRGIDFGSIPIPKTISFGIQAKF
jgi:TonB-linked SusC/RagA family outer membrane protein